MKFGYFILCALILSITLNVIFFSKSHIKTGETKIFSKLLFLNFIGLLIEFSCTYVSYKFSPYALPAIVFTRFYLIYLMTYLLYMTLYIYDVCYIEYSKRSDYYIKLRNLSYIIYFICLLIEVFLPLETAKGYAIGQAVDFIYICSTICIVIWFIPIVKNRKIIDFKKFIPLFCYVIFIGIIAIIQKVSPTTTLITTMEFIIIFIMYHTIENPDMKLLEEVHNAKVISDNANEEKTLFLYNMTNEIRNTTRNIDNEVNDILDSNSLENDKIYARNIKLETSKFKLMTNEILDISALDTASIKIYNEKYNIKTLLKEIIITYKDKVKGLDFRTNIASDIPEILYGDSLSIKNVLISLLDNSIKYTKRGYIELNVNMIKKQDVARLIISVEDSGIGIKSNELNQIFNKNKEKIDKYNLKNNLYTANKVTTLMGGTLLVSSTYGKGTVVKMILDQKIEVIDNKYDKVYDQKRILLVEDSEVTVKLINKMLKNTNITLDTVDLGSKAIEKIRNKEKYDLILLEEELKPLDAYQIIKKLKSIRNFNTKVILITKNKTLEYSDQLNFDKVLIKPIDKEQLLNKIDEYLQ